LSVEAKLVYVFLASYPVFGVDLATGLFALRPEETDANVLGLSVERFRDALAEVEAVRLIEICEGHVWLPRVFEANANNPKYQIHARDVLRLAPAALRQRFGKRYPQVG
jgi:hypothetical protein